MLHYNPRIKPRLAVIYTRNVLEMINTPSVELQEKLCLQYCKDNQIPVSHTVRVSCGAHDSLEVLRSMLCSLPKEVDTIFASNFYVYSTLLPDLFALCLVYQCHPAWINSLDVPGPLYRSLNVGSVRDFELADERYLELKRKNQRSS